MQKRQNNNKEELIIKQSKLKKKQINAFYHKNNIKNCQFDAKQGSPTKIYDKKLLNLIILITLILLTYNNCYFV